MNDATLRKLIVENSEHSLGLEKAVCLLLLDHNARSLQEVFDKLASMGCACGVVNGIGTNEEIASFYHTHQVEIDQIVREFEEANDHPIIVDKDYVTYVTWFAIEEVAEELYQKFTQ